MRNEFEIVWHPRVSHFKAFVVTIDYRTPHLHRDFELDLILRGEAVFVCQHRADTVRMGDMVLLNPNQSHEIRTESAPVTVLCIQVSPSFFLNALPEIERVMVDAFLPWQHMPEASRALFTQRMLELAEQYLCMHPRYGLLCAGLLHLMMHQLLMQLPAHLISEQEQRANLRRTERLRRILDTVDKNHTQNIHLSDLAKAEGLTLSYLSHFVKDHLHMTFQEYVGYVRFLHAKRLLLAGEKRLLVLAIESGFSDVRYLTKAFLRNTGLTPDTYRREHGGDDFAAQQLRSDSSQQYCEPQAALSLLRAYRQSLG